MPDPAHDGKPLYSEERENSFDDSEETVSVTETERTAADGSRAVDLTIILSDADTGGLTVGGRAVRAVGDDGVMLPLTHPFIPKLRITGPEAPVATGTGKKRKNPSPAALAEYNKSKAVTDIAIAIDQLEIDETQKVKLLLQSTKLARAVALMDVALNAGGTVALRALERLADEDEGKPSQRRPNDSDDEVNAITYDI